MKNLSPKDKKYIADYRCWFDKLSNKQKASMKAQGLDKPHIDDYTTRQKFDVSDIQIAAPEETSDESDEAKVFSRSQIISTLGSFAENFIHEIMKKKNVGLSCECMLFILGKSPYSSEQEIANSLKLTRASVSARCVELKDKFGMENSLFGRNLHIRNIYSKRAFDICDKYEQGSGN